jgi:hypothetical protein
MTPQSKLWWTGLAIYLISHVLPAIEGPVVRSGQAFGFYCAFYSLFFSAGQAVSLLRHEPAIMKPVSVFALFASGMLNVFFVAATLLIVRGRSPQPVEILFKSLVILMVPFCWVVFHYEDFYPIFGYYLWTLGMLLVLFAGRPAAEASSLASTD